MSLYNEIMEQPVRVYEHYWIHNASRLNALQKRFETGISAMYSWLPEELLIMPVGMPTTCLAQ